MNDIKEFVCNVNQLHAHYNECNKKFTADQIGFFNKVTEYANQGKNHFDLAKDLDFPAPLVAHIVSTVKEDMNTSDNFNYKKEYGSKFCDKFIEDTKNFIQPRKWGERVLRSPKPEIEMALDGLDNFWWGDNMWVNAPFEIPKEIMETSSHHPITLLVISTTKSWSFSLRLENFGNKHYLEASSEEEKTEVLEMLRLMNKYLT